MSFDFPAPRDKFKPCGDSEKLMYSPKRLIGKGSDSTLVYEGRFEGHPVAVKMIPRETFRGIINKVISEPMEKEDINEAKILRQYGHNNVIRYYLLDHDDIFIYLGLELCKGNLAEFLEFDRPVGLPSGDGRQIVKKHLLKGILDGLHYLHSENIIHGNLKPQNILLKTNESQQDQVGSAVEIKYNAVISDFGLSLKIDPGRTSKTAIDDLIGTDGWRPKEIIVKLEEFYYKHSDGSRPHISLDEEIGQLALDKGKIKGTKQVDIFAFGCIVQYVMAEREDVKGFVWYMHPFGDEKSRNRNIKKDKRCGFISGSKIDRLRHMIKLDEILADMLVGLCIDNNPQCRLSTKEINKHPFFWEPSTRYQFIEKAANHVKPLPFEDDLLKHLNKKWRQFYQGSYENEISSTVEYLKWNADRNNLSFNRGRCFHIYNLLRDIRNIQQHFSEIRSEYVGALISDLGDGGDEDFDRNFLQKIVQLFPIVYTCFYNIPRNEMGAYKVYFSNTENSNLIVLRENVYWNTLSKIFGPPTGDTVKIQPRKRPRRKTTSGESI